MIQKNKNFDTINAICELHKFMGIPGSIPQLLSLIKFEDINTFIRKENPNKVILNLYCISVIKGFKGKLKYGQGYYDCSKGGLSFIAPGQVCSVELAKHGDLIGYGLFFHPDLIRNHPLASQIKNYDFFSYDVNEALYLKEEEEILVNSILEKIIHECISSIDIFSLDIIATYIELLLKYSDRIYHRQFLKVKQLSYDILIELEIVLDEYFSSDLLRSSGLPTVRYISEKLNVTPNYLSYILKTRTGQSTQQHIHNKFIESAKHIIATTSLPVNDIAHQLGFEHPQYFSEIFKKKTSFSPLAYRNSFN
jgi:AraC family transcriptional regulator, transcriptional activator of pobA